MPRLVAFPLIVFAALLMAACESVPNILPEPKPPELWVSGYTCCNLRYYRNSNQISDGNYTEGVVIPAGMPIRVFKPGLRSYRADAEISGSFYVLTQDYGRSVEPFDAWVRRIVLPESPKAKISRWPLQVQDAVQAGQIMLGMSKEQVLVAIGHPLKTVTPTLTNNPWRYWHNTFNQYDVFWANGVVARVAKANDEIPVLAPEAVVRDRGLK